MNQLPPQGQIPSGHSGGYDNDGQSGLGEAFGHQDDAWRSPHVSAAPMPPPVDEPITGQRESSRRDPLILPSPEPEKKKRPRRSRVAQSQFLTFMSGMVTVLTLGALCAFAVLIEVRRDFYRKGPLTTVKTVVVPRNAGILDIQEQLVKNGVIRDEPVLFWNAFQIGKIAFAGGAVLKAGEWEFQPGMSMADVVNHLDDGKPVVHRITFPEGWTSEQIVAKLNADPILTGKVASTPDEGTVLPNTYQFSLGDTRGKIVDEMRKAQERDLKAIWEKRQEGLPLATMRDMVILASIVEKETGKPEERPHIAGVFINRLKRGMKLESDPTILYGLYKGAAWSEQRGGITRSELAAPNPYSTYKIAGLPPGPIANPGRAALEAVANPMKTNDIFFVADGTGGHVFAETLEEHNKNVARLRAIEAQRNAPAGPAPGSVVDVPAPARPAATPARPAVAPAPPAAAAPRPAPPPAPAAGTVRPAAPRPVPPPAAPVTAQ